MENNNRREFLKKVAYKAPAILALGTLVAPASVSGDSNVTVSPFSKSNSKSNDNDNDSSKSNGGLGSD